MAPKKKAAEHQPATEWHPRWKALHEYKTGTGMFRPRKVQWSVLASFALNPWSAGIMAHFSINHVNFTSMLAGGMSDPLQKFSPPPQFRDAFLASYELVRKSKKWLAYGVDPKDEGSSNWVEYNLLGENGKRVWEEESLNLWNGFFEQHRGEFNDIHDLFTHGGAAEPRILHIEAEDLLKQDDENTSYVAMALGSHGRTGLL